ncbi:MAG: carboxymuconolactone decarboxylase family protein [Planctomycetota bacterium]
MPRFATVSMDNADQQQRELLQQIQQSMGKVPNIFASMINSQAAVRFYLQGGQALAAGVLTPQQREAIALAVAGDNRCGYCASAHTALANKLGMSHEEQRANLHGRVHDTADRQTEALVAFGRTVSRQQGWAADAVEDARAAGLSDAQIIETIAVVCLNLFTNYFNHINETENDFPQVELPEASAP